MTHCKSWFINQVLIPRFVSSLCCQLLFLPFLCFVSVTFVTFNLLHPIDWIGGSLLSLASLSSCAHVIVIAIIVTLAAYYHYKCYSVISRIHSTRLRLLFNFVNPHCLIYVIAHTIFSGIVAFCLLGILSDSLPDEYRTLTSSCRGNRRCLNGRHVFVILHGLFVGFSSAANYVADDRRLVTFPIVEQRKFMAFKSSCQEAAVESASHVLRRLHLFYVAFYFIGPVLSSWIGSLLRVDAASSTLQLSSVSSLLDLQLFLTVFVTGMFVHFVWIASIKIFSIYLMQPTTFALEATFHSDAGHLLQDCLSCVDVPLLVHLAFRNLSTVSRRSAEKRKIIFGLSQPGGHPYKWISISSLCLGVVRKLIEDLSKTQATVSSCPVVSEVTDSTKADPIKLLTANVILLYEMIKSKPFITYFTSTLPHSGVRLCFTHCQPCIYAIEALTNLMVASYTEDDYGVVQQKLPKILSSFLSLYQILEKQQKSGTFSKKLPFRSSHPHDIKLGLKLKQTLKSSLYRICLVFNDDIANVIENPEQKRLILNFLDYKE